VSGPRIDIVTIFPDYLAPLRLALVGKAVEQGLIDIRVHDLRDHTDDRHRTVDDTPYGGGPGMVMLPEPWGRALDALVRADSLLIVPSPSGVPLRQAHATEWSTRSHIVIACGRYEGIDARVMEYYATRCEVREVSLGDYVLAGGEVAALVVVEAVTRLVPGVVGNAESLRDDSFAGGPMTDLLEGPVYTKPAEWRGLGVPEVLLSGNHAAIAAWRAGEARSRTAARRPDLAGPDLGGD
jgi:tRNA (guanine37-N1)-methyltransferase